MGSAVRRVHAHMVAERIVLKGRRNDRHWRCERCKNCFSGFSRAKKWALLV